MTRLSYSGVIHRLQLAVVLGAVGWTILGGWRTDRKCRDEPKNLPDLGMSAVAHCFLAPNGKQLTFDNEGKLATNDELKTSFLISVWILPSSLLTPIVSR